MEDKIEVITCEHHPNRQAWGRCDECGNYLCEECKHLGEKMVRGGTDRTLCPKCIIPHNKKKGIVTIAILLLAFVGAPLIGFLGYTYTTGR